MGNEKLERSRAGFRALLASWRETLTGEHPNAIWLQLHQLVTDEMWFQLVMRLRRRAHHPPVNDHLWNLFLTGYGVKQSLGIRRLTDDDERTASLWGVVDAMERNHHRFTRSVMVGADGIPMDVDGLREQISVATGHQEEQLAVQRWLDAGHAHENFDRLRDAAPGSSRRAHDQVSDQVWRRLKEDLSKPAIKKVRDRCNTYLAHADLSNLAKDLAGPTYNDIHESIRTLVHVDQFLRSTFFNQSSSMLSTFSGNPFDQLSSPLVPAMAEDVYEEEWHQVTAEMEHWGTVDEFRRYAIYPNLEGIEGPGRPFSPGPRIGSGKRRRRGHPGSPPCP